MNKFLALTASVVMAGCCFIDRDAMPEAGVKHLDEFDLATMTCGLHKRPQKNASLNGKALRLGDRTYLRGVGTHTESVMFFEANGLVDSFDAVVGIDREVLDFPASWRTRKNWGSALFRVYADGKLVADSGELKEKDAPKALHASLAGAKIIVLECTSGGHWAGYLTSQGDWCDAKFTYRAGAVLKPYRGPLDRQWGILTPAPRAAPAINGAAVWGVRPGHAVLWRVPVSGARPRTIAVEGLPKGLRFNPANQAIEGFAPDRAGDIPLVIRAENAAGKAERVVTLKVGEKIALTPPMGWNSWNIYASAITDAKVRDTARGMVESGLADHGWSYVNIDDWWMKNAACAKKGDPVHAGPVRDAAGRFLPNANFPDMKALCDYVHGLGLKIGIYSSPGATTCGGCEGSLGHERTDAETWAAWGIDYLKHDWCSYGKVFDAETKGRKPTVDDYAKPYRLMSQALRAQKRDIVHAFCQYGMGDVQFWGEEAGAQVWRSAGDLKDNWPTLLDATGRYADAWKNTRPGFWCDPDMMVLGYLNTDFGMHETFLTPNEQYTHMSLWCLLNAPLLLGCDLNHMSDFTKALLMNDEILAVNQDVLGRQAARVHHDDETDVWERPLSDGSRVLGVVNRRPFLRTVKIDFVEAKLPGTWKVRDLWRQDDLGTFTDSFEWEIPGHATLVLKLTK